MVNSPPLNAIRAFEAAARTGSFVAAARELGVSSPAVSQQVKLLEDYWQQGLFIRQGNRLSLTEAGQSAYPQLAQAMSSLTTLSERMQSKTPRTRRLVLSVPHSIAETWLGIGLAPLALDLDLTPINVRIDEDPIDFVQDKIDMRVFFGHDLYGDYQVDTLFSDRIVAVANDQLMQRVGANFRKVPDRCLIHTEWGRGFASSPKWEHVFQANRIIDRDQGMAVRASSTALNLVRHGLGVALVPFVIAYDDLRTGRVHRLDIPEQTLVGDYKIAYPKRLKADKTVARIVALLQSFPDDSRDET